jgi:hypothetical protein
LFVKLGIEEEKSDQHGRMSEEEKYWKTKTNKQTKSVALVRKRTIPTELPPLVAEVSANFC